MQFIVPTPAINKIEKIGLDMPFDIVFFFETETYIHQLNARPAGNQT